MLKKDSRFLIKILTIHDQDNTSLEENSKEDNLQESQALEENDKNVDIPKDLSNVWKFVQNHPKELIIGDPSKKVRTCSLSK